MTSATCVEQQTVYIRVLQRRKSSHLGKVVESPVSPGQPFTSKLDLEVTLTLPVTL